MRILAPLIVGLAAACFSMHVASAAPLLHYNFDEAASGSQDAIDHGTGTPAPGIFQGGATRTGNTPGGFSLGAADLSAANTYVTTPDPDKLDGLSQFTLKAWVNLQGAPGHGNRVMSKQDPGGNFDGFSFAFNNPTAGTIGADNFQLNMALGGSSGFTFNTSGANLDADNKWVFVAATYDGTQTSNNLQFWWGDELASVSPLGPTHTANSGTLTPNDFDFRVGAQSAGTFSAPVWIDNVEVYGRVLSLEELEANRLGNLIPEPSSLLLLALGLAGMGFAGRRRK